MGLIIKHIFLFSLLFCVGEKMPIEVVHYFAKYPLLSETSYENNVLYEIQDFINTACTKDSIIIEDFSFSTVNSKDSNGIILSFDFAILNINYSLKRNSVIGYNSVFIIDNNYFIKDELTVLRYVKSTPNKVLFLSEILYLNKSNSVSIRNYKLENQDYNMHPYMTKIDTTLKVKINTQNLSFMK